jgi:hypothetical protein
MRSRFDEAWAPAGNVTSDILSDLRIVVRRCSGSRISQDIADGLTEERLGDLIALTWIARGLYAPNEWDDARFEGSAAYDASAALRILYHPHFSRWLREGLAMLEDELAPTLH